MYTPSPPPRHQTLNLFDGKPSGFWTKFRRHILSMVSGFRKPPTIKIYSRMPAITNGFLCHSLHLQQWEVFEILIPKLEKSLDRSPTPSRPEPVMSHMLS